LPIAIQHSISIPPLVSYLTSAKQPAEQLEAEAYSSVSAFLAPDGDAATQGTTASDTVAASTSARSASSKMAALHNNGGGKVGSGGGGGALSTTNASETQLYQLFGNAHDKLSIMAIHQVDDDNVEFCEPLKDYIRLCASVQEMVANRTALQLRADSAVFQLRTKEQLLSEMRGKQGKEMYALRVSFLMSHHYFVSLVEGRHT
jgi:hypothetical protein